MNHDFVPLHTLPGVLPDEPNPISNRSSARTLDLGQEGLGARKATLLYGSKARKYELGGELRMSSGLRIDYVLVHTVFADEGKQEALEAKAKEKLLAGIKDDDDHVMSRTLKRLSFLHKLRETHGVDYEQELGKNKTHVFTKLHCSFNLLLDMAEKINLNLGLVDEEQLERKEMLSVGDKVTSWFSETGKRFAKRFDVFDHGLPEPEDFYSAAFRKDKLHKFRNFQDENLFFSDAQRGTLTFEMLSGLQYGHKKDQIGIRKLMNNNTFLDAFPLHDGPLPKNDDEFAPANQSVRAQLYLRWARIRRFYKRQPIETIRSYFGETVGIYFAWLGFYTMWLILPSFVGFVVFLYGLATFEDQTDAKELCDKAVNMTMCPLCDSCETWQLSEICTPYKFSWVFDNGATIFFAVFMSIWASVFQDFWRRYNAKLAYEWDVRSLSMEEPDRPQFKALGDKTRKHPITGAIEKDYPKQLRFLKYGVTFSAVVVTLAAVIMVVLSIILYRLAISIAVFKNGSTSVRPQAGVIAAVTAAILNLMAITILNYFYGSLAIKMTDWENHRKDSKYESHLAFKIFVFQFVNTYSSLFYVAFFKGQFNGYPGHYEKFFGFRQVECAEYGCLLELTIQLSIIMVGKQAIGNITEFVIPRLKRWNEHRKAKKKHVDAQLLPWEEQFELEEWPESDLFYEYLEMIIQFGFITLFVASFPLSPLFAFLNNIMEIRIDADKMITALRRPPASRASDIGIWEGVLEFVSFFSVITNGLVIAVTSNFLTKAVYRENYGPGLHGFINKTHPFFPDVGCFYTTLRDGNGDKGKFYYEVWAAKLGFLIAFEHAVFFGKAAAQAMIPNVPRATLLKIKREEYLAAKALRDQLDDDAHDDDTVVPEASA